MKELIIKIDEEKMDIEGNAPVVDRPQELVRCKDCKWFHQAFENEGRCIKHYNDFHKPDWYCADGERKK